jgi:hypothetical protein
MLMGPKGATIQRLRRQTGCQIAVSAKVAVVPTQAITLLTQVITVRGLTAESVAAARAAIERTLASLPSPPASPHTHGASAAFLSPAASPVSPAGSDVALFDAWPTFLADIARRNMKPSFKAHSPGCRCPKVHCALHSKTNEMVWVLEAFRVLRIHLFCFCCCTCVKF